MQTFLPYKSFVDSSLVLDNKRLGKQRVEALQIYNALSPESKSKWKNHPAVRMWKGHENLLKYYYNCIVREWVRRGFQNNMILMQCEWPTASEYPKWLGDERLHSSHRANLLRKDPVFYGKYGWTDDPTAPYWWPVELKNKELNERMNEFWNEVLKL